MGSVLIQTGGKSTNVLNSMLGTNSYEIKAKSLNECRLIGDYAFYQDAVKSIEIPIGAFRIGDYAFYECSNLTDVYIPATVITIGDYAFANCTSLQVIHFGGLESSWNNIEKGSGWNDNTSFQVEFTQPTDNLTFNLFGDVYEVSSSGNDPKVVIIPDEHDGIPVRRIAYEGFRGSSANYICLPPTISVIGDSAFVNSSIRELSIPNSYTGSMPSVSGCSNLDCIAVGNGVSSINYLQQSNTLRILYIGNSVTSIPSFDPSLFRNLNIIVSKSNQNYCTENGYLYTKYKDELIWIPYSTVELVVLRQVERFGTYVLNSSMLKTISVDADNTVYSSYDGILYSKDITTLVRIPTNYSDSITIQSGVVTIGRNAAYNCKSQSPVSIPSGVTTIENNAFAYSSIKGLILPLSLRTIGNNAFAYCSDMQFVRFPVYVTSVGEGAFRGCSQLYSVSLQYTNDDSLLYWWKIDFEDEASNPLTYANRLYGAVEITRWTAVYDPTLAECKQYTFSGWNGTEITIPPSTTNIGSGFLKNCRNLTVINYNNTIATWNTITKSVGWDSGTGNYVIHCTDGDISK